MCLWFEMKKTQTNEQNVCPSLDISVNPSICPQSLMNGLCQVSVTMPELNPQICTACPHVTKKLYSLDKEVDKLQ